MSGVRVPEALSPQIALDRSGGAAMHRQLYDALRGAILGGAFAPGARLPSTRALAADLGVSRTTVLQAFDRLVGEGYATARSGGGTRVAAALPARPGPRGGGRAGGAGGHDAPNVRPAAPRLSRAGLAYLGAVKHRRPDYDRVRPFALGVPALDHFPAQQWARLVARRWRRDPVALLGYADECGYRPLRTAIAQYAIAARGVRCTPDQVVVVNGAQHGIDLVARLLLDEGDAVWVEEPGYRPVRAALRATGAQLVDVPVDDQGLVVSEGVRRAPWARLAFVTPSYQAPLGVALSLERRLALLDWAERVDAWVVEDDYNGEFRYDTHPLPSVQGLDRTGRVLYVGTFSKTLAPGLRVGYLVVPPALVEPIARARIASDRHTPVAEQAVLADFIAGGHLARHVRRTRELYRQRQQHLVAQAAALTGGLLEVCPAPAGMRVVGLLPAGVSARAVAQAALLRDVFVTPLPAAAHERVPPERDGLLLGYAGFGAADTRAALLVLRDVIRDADRAV
jgi:GntR family transcriptional regulator/MocR family aminotransferase